MLGRPLSSIFYLDLFLPTPDATLPRTKARLRLLPLPILAASGDLVLTLYGQGPHYWAGGRDRVNEANPQFNQLLQIHPLAFIAGGLAWIAVFSVLILVLPRRLSLWLVLGVVMGHTWGMTTWIRSLWPEPSYWVCLALWLVVSGATAFALSGGSGGRVEDRA